MYFTREPIILTIITPKEGCKLLVRSFKGASEYLVDAVEMVSFDGSLFFRSLERMKDFLVPTSSYEVIEVKEQRPNIKINETITSKSSLEKKKQPKKKKIKEITPPIEKEKGGDKKDEANKVSSSKRKLLKPPAKLIKENLAKIKDEEFFEKNILPGEVEDIEKK